MVPAPVYRPRSVNIEPSMYAGIKYVLKLSPGNDVNKMSPVLSWTAPCIEPPMYAGIRGVLKLSPGKDAYKMSPVLSWTTPLAASLCTV